MEIIEDNNLQEMEIAIEKEARAYQGMGIKLLSIAGGLLGSLFITSFIFMFLTDSAVASILIGLITLIAALYADKKFDSTVVDTACIGGYIAACAMMGYGINKAFGNDNITTLLMLATAMGVMRFTTSYMLNFISVLIVTGSLFSFISINNAYELIHVLVAILVLSYTLFSLYEAKLLASGPRINMVYNSWRNALLCAVLALLAYIAVDNVFAEHITYEWISSIVIIGTYLFFLNKLTDYLQIAQYAIRIYSFSLLIMLMAVFSPAICGALLILLISFHVGHRLGLILGVIALVYFTGQFYYNLHYTLLIKSMMMFGTGIMFLAAWYILRKTSKRYEQA